VLNLDGNVTTTGNLSFTDGAFTGANLRQLNIGATDRIFTIGAGTTTTIAPDIAGTAGITKRGNGTLQLTAASASNYSGITYVEAGTFITTPSHTAGSIFVNPSATFGVALASSNTTFIAAEIGTDPGAILQLGLGALGNPVAPVMNANTLTIGGATTIRVVGTNLTSATEIPLIAYGSMTGPVGFGDLSLVLPPRIAGSLVDNTTNSRIDLSINGIDQIKWTGSVNGNWDIDADTTGTTGTLNWKTTISATAARYFQGSVATDTASFDDSATGTRVVNLTTNLTPVAVNVDNSAGDYTFSGTGKLTGATSLNKSGTGTLILANSAAYDHTGGTTINAGTLQIGDGTSNAVGFLPLGAISNNGTLIFNTVDDTTVAQAISGTGVIVKNNANLLAFTAAATNAHNYTVNAGTMRFNGAATLSGNITIASGAVTLNVGGALSGEISGAGALNSLAGTLQLNGSAANTFTGLTTVGGGTLQLAKAANTTAVGGDITVTGGGLLVVLSPEQIPDTATLRFLGTSGDPMVGSTGMETVANVLVNPSVSTGQLVMRAGFTVTNLATLQNGILGVGSGNTATLNAVNMGTGTILRIAGNSAASTLNIGPGGITASGGEIQIKFNTNPQDAVLNLGGNFIATGNVAITNAGYNGTNLNVIDLGAADRTFDIADSTSTTVAPDLTSTGGGLIKTGNGTLQLTDLSIATYTGITDIVAGTLDLRGAISGTSSVNITGTLTGNGGITVASGGNININSGGKLSPGFTNGTLTAGLSGGGQFNIAGAATSVTPSFNFELDTPFSSDKVTLVGGALNIGSGVLDFSDFNFAMLSAVVPDTDYVLFDGDTPIIGTLSANISGDIGGYTSTLQIGDNGNDLILHIPEPGSAALLLGGLAMLAGRRRSKKE
jgi:autotransporter-associated beta strand protein